MLPDRSEPMIFPAGEAASLAQIYSKHPKVQIEFGVEDPLDDCPESSAQKPSRKKSQVKKPPTKKSRTAASSGAENVPPSRSNIGVESQQFTSHADVNQPQGNLLINLLPPQSKFAAFNMPALHSMPAAQPMHNYPPPLHMPVPSTLVPAYGPFSPSMPIFMQPNQLPQTMLHAAIAQNNVRMQNRQNFILNAGPTTQNVVKSSQPDGIKKTAVGFQQVAQQTETKVKNGEVSQSCRNWAVGNLALNISVN